MDILRVLVVLIFAASFAGCASHIPVLETQDDAPTTTASVLAPQDGDDVPATVQPDRTPAPKVKSEAKKPKPKPPAPNQPAAASKTPHSDTINPTAANLGSPEKWKKERAEDERKEQQLKQVIEGICRGC